MRTVSRWATVAAVCTALLAGVMASAPAAAAAIPAPPAETTTTLSVITPASYGQTLSLRVVVTNTVTPATVPVGTVKLTDGGMTVATHTLVNGSVGFVTRAQSRVGVHTFTAYFLPSDSTLFIDSPSSPVSTTVTKRRVGVGLKLWPSSAIDAGRRIALTATTVPAVAGIATFSDGRRVMGRVPLTSGKAKLRLIPARGNHSYSVTVTPRYTDRYVGSRSSPRALSAGAAKSLPLTSDAFGPLVRKVELQLVHAGVLSRSDGVYGRADAIAVTRFQGKFSLRRNGNVDKSTEAKLRSLDLPHLPKQCTAVSMAICVDKTRKIAQLVIRGRVLISLDARFGSLREPGLATREGLFSVQRKSANHVSSQYHTPMPFAMFFSGGQAVHYSKFFAAVGYNGASHGCVNTRDLAGIKRMFSLVHLRTRVYIFRS